MPIGHEKHVGHAAGISQRHVFLHPPLLPNESTGYLEQLQRFKNNFKCECLKVALTGRAAGVKEPHQCFHDSVTSWCSSVVATAAFAFPLPLFLFLPLPSFEDCKHFKSTGIYEVAWLTPVVLMALRFGLRANCFLLSFHCAMHSVLAIRLASKIGEGPVQEPRSWVQK